MAGVLAATRALFTNDRITSTELGTRTDSQVSRAGRGGLGISKLGSDREFSH